MKLSSYLLLVLVVTSGCSSGERSEDTIRAETRKDFAIEVDGDSFYPSPSPFTVYFSSNSDPEVHWGVSATEANPVEFGIQLGSLSFLENRELEVTDLNTQAFLSIGGQQVTDGRVFVEFEPGPAGTNATLRLSARTEGSASDVEMKGLVTLSCVVPEREMPGAENSEALTDSGEEIRVRDTSFVSARCRDVRALVQ